MAMSAPDFEQLATILATRDNAVAGLTHAELLELERGLGGMRLPLAYRDFMKRMGRDAGPLLAGTDAFYPQIIDYQAEAWELVSDEKIGHLVPAESIIFATHQGYQIYWMSSEAGDDPPVFMYQENDQKISRRWESFSEFVYGEFERFHSGRQ
ncbi:hypothetical protein Psi02_42490 [Planotetraspora silvatica]|uniref:Knr4/Smi1-like domain-containing protein n=1 Tax=Planotetraspora silvatica TaxID=234614 RepID=A0A8J3XP31_9ACTN|nr:SMI1/KNR4 family protein [Planotetraspora silvatica]GII47825.1 hypothetical protein Psi02_42490 [Planotetraspora silvatica]